MMPLQNSHVKNCWERRQPSCVIHELVTDNLVPCNSFLATAASWSHFALASSFHPTKTMSQEYIERRQPSCLIYELVTDNLIQCNSAVVPHIINYCRFPLCQWLDPSFCLVDFTCPFSLRLLCFALLLVEESILIVVSLHVSNGPTPISQLFLDCILLSTIHSSSVLNADSTRHSYKDCKGPSCCAVVVVRSWVWIIYYLILTCPIF
jgi:hypothetical protein